MTIKRRQGTSPVQISLRGVVYRDGGWWVSHCLELDIVGQGASPQEAFDQGIELCQAQFAAAMADGDLESIIRPAPAGVWAMYYRADGKERSTSDRGLLHRAEFRELRAA